MHHLRSLVERLAVEKVNPEGAALQCRRAFNQFKLQLTGAGFDTMAIQCGALELTSRRGMPHGAKVRILRDGLGSLTRMIDTERRRINMAATRDAPTDTDDAGS